jgi:hypothetical protein
VGPLLCESLIKHWCLLLPTPLFDTGIDTRVKLSRTSLRLREVGVNFEVVGNPENGVDSENEVNSGNGANLEQHV